MKLAGLDIKKDGWLILALALTLVISVIYLSLDVMEVDTAQYASIAREMAENGYWLQVQHEGKDYLDKPPLLFWMSALSFKLFGISNIAFKLPALIMMLVGAYATYRLARRFYPEDGARWGGVILLTCQASFLLVNNVLTDSLLVGSVALATWMILEYTFKQRWYWLVGGAAGIAMAMLAKGPIGLMVPVLALSTHWIAKREWKWFFCWQWLIMLALVAVLLAPMVWGLYRQYGSYGPYFYFWEQSFGRLTGQNAFVNSLAQPQPNDPTYFIHTYLWSFLPWSLVGLIALGAVAYGTVSRKWKLPEYLSLGGFLLPAIALSFSQYKLPHYLYVTYPFAAILLVGYLSRTIESGFLKAIRAVRWVQVVLALLLVVVAAVFVTYCFPGMSWWKWIIFILIIGLVILTVRSADRWVRLLGPALFGILAVQWLLAAQAYPVLFSYQSGAQAGQWKTDHQIPDDQFYGLYQSGHALNFYGRTIIHPMDAETIVSKADSLGKPVYVFADETGLKRLQSQAETEIIETYDNYRIAFLKWTFLNPKTREEAVKKRYLIEVVAR